MKKVPKKFPFEYSPELAKALSPYLEITEKGPLLIALFEELDQSEQPTNDFLVKVNQLVNQKLFYNIRMNPGVQNCEETLDKKKWFLSGFRLVDGSTFKALWVSRPVCFRVFCTVKT